MRFCRVCATLAEDEFARTRGLNLCRSCADAAGDELVERLRRAAWWIAAPKAEELDAAVIEYREAWRAVGEAVRADA